MHPKQFALIGGILMLVVGLLSLVPNLSQGSLDLPVLNVESSYGLFLGVFAMNILNKIILIALGAWGVFAATRPATSLPASINYSRWVFGIAGVLSVMGMITATNTTFGYMPLFGWQVLTAGVWSVLGAYFGFALPARLHAEGRSPAHSVHTTLREV